MQFSEGKNSFTIQEKRSKPTRGEHAVVNTLQFMYMVRS